MITLTFTPAQVEELAVTLRERISALDKAAFDIRKVPELAELKMSYMISIGDCREMLRQVEAA